MYFPSVSRLVFVCRRGRHRISNHGCVEWAGPYKSEPNGGRVYRDAHFVHLYSWSDAIQRFLHQPYWGMLSWFVIAEKSSSFTGHITSYPKSKPTDLVRQSLPFTYLTMSASSTDGNSHNVRMYVSINGGAYLLISSAQGELLTVVFSLSGFDD